MVDSGVGFLAVSEVKLYAARHFHHPRVLYCLEVSGLESERWFNGSFICPWLSLLSSLIGCSSPWLVIGLEVYFTWLCPSVNPPNKYSCEKIWRFDEAISFTCKIGRIVALWELLAKMKDPNPIPRFFF